MLEIAVRKEKAAWRRQIRREVRDEALREGLLEGRREGKREGKREGRREGKREGLREGKYAVARKMISRGFQTALIAEITGLSQTELRKLTQKTKE